MRGRTVRPAWVLALLCCSTLLVGALAQLDLGAGGRGDPAPVEPPGPPQDQQEEEDDSVRCRMSGICDGPPPPGACPLPHLARAAYTDLDPEQRDLLLACTWHPAQRAAMVAEAVAWSWKGYRDCAWGWDELQPLSCSGAHWLNLTLTLVDALDTLYLAGLTREFAEAAEWVVAHLDVAAPGAVNLFETTIRILGGLLSAHHLCAASHPTLSAGLAAKAAELGSRLLPAFKASPSGIPYSDVNLRTGKARSPAWANVSSLSEIATLSLEFTTLSRITGRPEFEEAALSVHSRLGRFVERYDGLLPLYFNPESGGRGSASGGGTVTLGARADSYYEYLLKQWLMSGSAPGSLLRARYVHAMRGVRRRLVRRTAPAPAGGLVYVGEQSGHRRSGRHVSKMDHLVCFLPGLLALGDLHGVDTSQPSTEQGGASSPPGHSRRGGSGPRSDGGGSRRAGSAAAAAAGSGSTGAAAAAAVAARSSRRRLKASSALVQVGGGESKSGGGRCREGEAAAGASTCRGREEAAAAVAIATGTCPAVSTAREGQCGSNRGGSDLGAAVAAGTTPDDAACGGDAAGGRKPAAARTTAGAGEGAEGGGREAQAQAEAQHGGEDEDEEEVGDEEEEEGVIEEDWERASDLDLAEALAATCYELYRRTPAGLAPEIVHFATRAEAGGAEYPSKHPQDVGGGHFTVKELDAHNLLRPETVESLYLLWKVTGRPRYREWAWAIFRAFQRWCRVQDMQQCLAARPTRPAPAPTSVPAVAGGAAEEEQQQAEQAEVQDPEQNVQQQKQAREQGQQQAEQQQQQQQQQQFAQRLLQELLGDGRLQQLLAAGSGAVSGSGFQLAGGAAAKHEGGGDGSSWSKDRTAGEGEQAALSPEAQLQQWVREAAARAAAGSGPGMDSRGSGAEPGQDEGGGEEAAGAGADGGCEAPAAARAGGYSNLGSVLSVPPPRRDKMESFWVAETLKYLYLIFVEPPERCLDASCRGGADEHGVESRGEGGAVGRTLISLRTHVFNTEAHPLPAVGTRPPAGAAEAL